MNAGSSDGIAAGASKTVSFKPLIGIFNQSKYLPLMWGGFVVEFDLIGCATEAIITGVTGGDFTPTDTSSTWEISDVRFVGDQVTLDSASQNSYAEHVLGGKTLPINYNTFITMQQAVSGGNISVNSSRAVSRLKTLYFSFCGGDPAAGQDGIADAAAVALS